MATAPVCNNAPANVPGQPDPKSLPSIPEATDLASALAAIAAMRRILQQIINNTNLGGLSGFKLQNAKNKGMKELRQFRVTKRVRIYNPEDHTQWVDVDQIVGMVMQDPVSGQTWQWQQ